MKDIQINEKFSYNVRQVSQILGIKIADVYKLCISGEVESFYMKRNGKKYVHGKSLKLFMEESKNEKRNLN